jgi:hypothetical protein
MFELRNGDKIVGRFSGEQIQSLAQQGKLRVGMEIRQLPSGEWKPLSKVKVQGVPLAVSPRAAGGKAGAGQAPRPRPPAPPAKSNPPHARRLSDEQVSGWMGQPPKAEPNAPAEPPDLAQRKAPPGSTGNPRPRAGSITPVTPEAVIQGAAPPRRAATDSARAGCRLSSRHRGASQRKCRRWRGAQLGHRFSDTRRARAIHNLHSIRRNTVEQCGAFAGARGHGRCGAAPGERHWLLYRRQHDLQFDPLAGFGPGPFIEQFSILSS